MQALIGEVKGAEMRFGVGFHAVSNAIPLRGSQSDVADNWGLGAAITDGIGRSFYLVKQLKSRNADTKNATEMELASTSRSTEKRLLACLTLPAIPSIDSTSLARPAGKEMA